jgi:hypothetical protein
MDEEKNWFGSSLILNDDVKFIEEDEDLKTFGKCAKYIAKMYAEIQETGKSTQNIKDLWKEIENGKRK